MALFFISGSEKADNGLEYMLWSWAAEPKEKGDTKDLN